jgi:nicotinamide-nucleotide amidase
MVNAEIITIGDELLIGQVVNTNSSFLAREMNSIGISIIRMTSVADTSEAIISALGEAASRADVIIGTGGLGPTSDDITKPALAKYFNSPLVLFPEILEQVKTWLALRGAVLRNINTSQAMLPANCRALRNTAGTAPGMWFDHNGKVYVFLPGVPYEMEQIVRDHVKQNLQQAFKLPAIVHETILTSGLAESEIALRLEKWEEGLPDNLKLAYLPSPGMVRLRISGNGDDRAELEKQVGSAKTGLEAILEKYIFGYNEEKPEETLSRILAGKKLTLSTAESCTGGTLGSIITSVPGSSAYYKGGVIAYSNELKVSILGVPDTLISKNGAVSREVAMAMAEGARKNFGSDISVAITGIAGPSGGSPEKPVGTVWIALASPKGTEASIFYFGEHRGRNIQKASITALVILKKLLEDY